jgi:signal transduction histidine kinase
LRAPLGPAVELPAGQSPDGAGPGASGQAALLAVVAHELRAPLQSLCAGSEQLVDHLDELDPAQIADRVRILRRGSLQLWTLVENLLRTARSGAGDDDDRPVCPGAAGPRERRGIPSRALMQQKSQALRVSAPPVLIPSE